MVATATIWELYNCSTGVVSPGIDPSVAVVICDLNKLNTAKIACSSPSPITEGTEVVIRERVTSAVDGSLLEIHTILYGEVTTYKERSKGITNNVYDYSITEKAVELEKFRVHSSGPNYTVNLPSQALGTSVNTVLYESGWTVGGTPPSANVLEAIQMKLMTGLAALNKLICELGAATATTQYYLWFDAATGGGAKTVGWGLHRNDRTSVNFIKGIYYGYEDYTTKKAQADGVIIYGAGMASVGQYPASITGHEIAVYQYDDASTNAECTALAARVYLDFCKDPKRRIQFKVDPRKTKVGGSYILEGDQIQVDGSIYTIVDMTYSMKYVQIGVNAGQDSILYSLGDRLKPISGGTSGYVDQNWSPGQQNVAGDNTTWTTFAFPLKDTSYLGPSVSMLVQLAAYRAYSYQSATSVTNEMLSESTIPAYYSATSYNGTVACGATAYLPFVAGTPMVYSATVEGGFQYALGTVSFKLSNLDPDNGPANTVYVAASYSYNGTDWYEGSYQLKVDVRECPADLVDADRLFVTSTYLIPGINQTSRCYVRWVVTNTFTGSGVILLEGVNCNLEVIPRHTHILFQEGAATTNQITASQVDDVKDQAATPVSITCQVNSAAEFSVTNGAEYDIKSQLVSGINSIRFRAPTPCTVTPSATYKSFPY